MRIYLLIFVVLSTLWAHAQAKGCSLRLDGKSQLAVDRFVEHFDHKGVQIEPAFLTFEAWVNPEALFYILTIDQPINHPIIFQTGVIWADIPTSIVIRYDSVNNNIFVEKWKMINEHWTKQIINFPSDIVNPDVWTHIVFHAAKEDLFINGELVAPSHHSQAHSGPASTPIFPPFRFAIGTNFTGLIDEVRVWNMTLSSRDVNSHMTKSVCPTMWRGALILDLTFDECDGNVTVDYGYSHGCGRIRSGVHHHRRHGKGMSHRKHDIDHTDGEKFPVPLFLVDIHAHTPTFNGGDHHKNEHEESSAPHPSTHTYTSNGRPGHKFNKVKRALVYGAAAPVASQMCETALVSATVQCPYRHPKPDDKPIVIGGDSHDHHHPTPNVPSYSESGSDWIDFDDLLLNSLWTQMCLIGTLSICLCMCRRARRRRQAARAYQQVPQNDPAQFDDYPGAYYSSRPATSEQATETAPEPQERQAPAPAPFAAPFPFPPQGAAPMHPFHPMAMPPFPDPRMMYYMQYRPQMMAPPVFYAPNQPWAQNQEQQQQE